MAVVKDTGLETLMVLWLATDLVRLLESLLELLMVLMKATL